MPHSYKPRTTLRVSLVDTSNAVYRVLTRGTLYCRFNRRLKQL
nr:MAG TPA: hypothetical protein [Caudoviricetes sp.]